MSDNIKMYLPLVLLLAFVESFHGEMIQCFVGNSNINIYFATGKLYISIIKIDTVVRGSFLKLRNCLC